MSKRVPGKATDTRTQLVTDPIPSDVRAFVLNRVDTVAEMEALVIMSKDPGDDWGIASVAERLYIAPADAEKVLAGLCRQRLAVAHGGVFRLQPATARDSETLHALVALYAVHLIAITHLIHAKAGSRIQEFADAFQLRKDLP